MSDSSIPPATISRRHDLDALRGIAMLLGIVLHGAIAFIPGAFFWPVRDSSPHLGFGLLNATIHGFRMPLFFLVSGFFTAMLWRKRGLRRLIEHRFQRIFLPLLLGMFTIVPATWIVPGVLSALDNRSREDKSEQVAGAPQEEQVADAKTQELLAAASTGDVEGLNELLAAGVDVNGSDGEGNTALHAAIFFGRDEIVPILLDAGADQEAVNDEGRRPADGLQSPWWLTSMIAGGFGIPLDQDEFQAGRTNIAEHLGVEMPDLGIDGPSPGGGLVQTLMAIPLMGHLWFLWFLCWLVLAFTGFVFVARKVKLPLFPRVLTVSVWRYAWLIPLTAGAEYLMNSTGQVEFGPATSIGILPMPSVLAYYAIFFFFGALYFNADDQEHAVGRYWWLALVIAAVILPVGLMATHNRSNQLVAVLSQAAYAWLMCFGLMGCFHHFLSRESPVLRYLSDSSYWLYLAHIPLIYVPQFIVRDWSLWAPLKLVVVCVSTTAVLLLSYQWFVRYTVIGTLLNGPRRRSNTKPNPKDKAIEVVPIEAA